LFEPAIYGLILAVNVAIAVMIALLEKERERGVTQLERTVAELRAAEARNDALQEQLITQAREAGVTEERQRLSREIHDTVAQSLVGIITQLEAADASDETERLARLARVRDTARQALGEARRAVRALASPRLDERSLPDALAGLVAETGLQGVDARLVVEGEEYASRGDAELVRLTQEALANVVRHASATRVVVTLDYDPTEVRLDVRDDGVGFDPTAPTAGHGLRGMRERVALLGGTLEVEAPEGGSCTVSVAIPR
ncbi:MAG: sensor histidine kinase, partial [Propionibacteriaceae bacterium]|nr:sensor histidine kinase [Propionibacteriaceae bacterium]